MTETLGAIIGAAGASLLILPAIWCATIGITLSWIAKMLVKYPLAANFVFGVFVALIATGLTFLVSLVLGIPFIN